MAAQEVASQANNSEAETLLKHLLSKAVKKPSGLLIGIKDEGVRRLHGGEITGVVVKDCWAFFTHSGEQFRSETVADKEKMLAGTFELAVIKRLSSRKQEVAEEIEETRPSGFVPRSRRFGAAASF